MPARRNTCEVCGKPIVPPKRAYCSKSCMVSAQIKRDSKKKFQKRLAEMAELEVESIDDGEEWRPIAGYEGEYEVSNYGRVRSCGFIQTAANGRRILMRPRLLTQQMTKDGYFRVEISKQGKQKRFAVHRLVADAFIPNPDSKPQVNHIDSNRGNNRVENLEWVTSSENTIHGYRYGFFNPDPTKMINARKRPVIRSDGSVFPSIADAARAEGLTSSGLSWHIKHETKTKGGGFFYRYADEPDYVEEETT